MLKYLSTMAKAFFGSHKLLAQVSEIPTTETFQFAPFEHIPVLFLWITFGCVTRQALQMQPLALLGREKFLDHFCPMNRRTIPNHKEFARNFAPQQA